MNSEVVDSIRRGKDKVIQLYELMPARCLQEDVPDLLSGMRQAMKQYVVAESKWQDLNTSKERVSQSINQLLSENITEALIRQEVEKAFEHETSKRQEEFWLQERNYSSLVDFSQGSESEAAAAADDDGEDIAVTSQAIQTIDPYTKREFVDPVKNVVCNHAYERSTIMELLKAGRAPRCYHMGCNNKKVLASDLVPDDDLKRHMARLRARSDM